MKIKKLKRGSTRPSRPEKPQNSPYVDALKYCRTAYKNYGRYVLESRAIPDIRDGQKPVHRRLALSVRDVLGASTTKTVKSAKVVGGCIATYHPHGDSAAYEALVTGVHDRCPVVFGRGNFGNAVAGDRAAAMRYTEVGATPLSGLLFECSDIAATKPNFDGTKEEPVVHSSRVPLLLLNGSSSIGFGFSTNVHPHNPVEVIEALKMLVDDPKLSQAELPISGPDYSGGGILLSPREEVDEVYESGGGSLNFRCRYAYRDSEEGPELVVTEPMPNFRIQNFVAKTEKLVEEGVISYVSDLSTDRMELVIGFRNHVELQRKVLPLLQGRVTVNQTVWCPKRRLRVGRFLKAGVYKMSFRRLALVWLNWRRTEEKRFLTLELKRQEEQLARELAKRIVADNLDLTVEIIRTETSREDVIRRFQDDLGLTEFQAEYVLGQSLASLASFNREKLEEAIGKIEGKIEETQNWLRNIDDWVKMQLDRVLDAIPKELRKRFTQLGDEQVDVPESADLSRFFVAKGNEIKILKGVPEIDQRDRKSIVCSTSGRVLVVEETGRAFYVSSLMKRIEAQSRIVGLIPEDIPYTMVICEPGRTAKVAKIKTNVNKDEFWVVPKGTKIRSAFGVGEKTPSVVINSSWVVTAYPSRKIPVRRDGSKPIPLVGGKDVRIAQAGSEFYSREDGFKLEMSDINNDWSSVVQLGDKNLAWKTGAKKPKVVGRDEVIAGMESVSLGGEFPWVRVMPIH